MLTRQFKIYIAITAIVLAVILLLLAYNNYRNFDETIPEGVFVEEPARLPLNGAILTEDNKDYFAIAIMIDNAYNLRPQYGLSQADIIYEALTEGTVTRLMAIFNSNVDIDKIGPVRSARNYYMDWAEEYAGVYMHVGGSPQALKAVKNYDFTNIDQIGVGEIYFWRDNNLSMPHNVFSSSANWLRVGELKEVDNIHHNIAWRFVDFPEEDKETKDITINFSNGAYQVDWKYSQGLKAYQRWQAEEEYDYSTGEQAIAHNIIVQVVEDYLIDEERRGMQTKKSGEVFIFNALGEQIGEWKYIDNRTRFFDEQGEELELVPGKTWVEIIDTKEKLVLN